MVRPFASLIFMVQFLVIFASCGNKGKSAGEEQADPELISAVKDSSYLFDGKTLNGWEISNFGPQGPVYVSGDAIILSMGDGCTGVTWKGDFPRVGYRVTLEAKRISGNDFFCGMTFPVEDDPCTLIVGGWGGPVVGLSCIDLKDASENETTKLIKFETGRWYNICLEVQKDSIKACIDGENVVKVGIKGKILSIRPEVELSKPFGIASWRTTAALRNIRVEKTED